MHLITPYAPGSFLKPCAVFSTLYAGKTKETVVMFVSALNCEHALKIIYTKGVNYSNSAVIKTHKTKKAAIDFHVSLARKFQNGGTEKEWSAGWDDYLKIYEEFYEKAKEDNHAQTR